MGQEQGSYIDGDSGADFVYGYGGGGDEVSIDLGGGGIDFGDADFFYGYGAGESGQYGGPIDYTPSFEEIPYAPYEQSWGIEEFVPLADIIETSERELLPEALGPETYYGLPYIPDPFLTPYTPIFPDLPPPLPPIITPIIPFNIPAPPQIPLPKATGSGPIPIAPGLPPACPVGQYHPYPIGHPEQNKCIPFPPAQTGSTAQQQQKSGGGASSSGSQSKPPAQQACPTGYCKHPTTGQCVPIPSGYTRHPQTQVCTPTQAQQQQTKCPTGYYGPVNGQCLPIPKCTTPGTVFDQARGLCVPKDQAISPLPEGVEGLFDELSKLPWWIWLALGGLLLLSRDNDGKKTTVTYRRAR